MSQMDCRNLGEDGTCQGMYRGFGCIGEKCKDPTRGPREPKCRHLTGNGYCRKHGRFECPGEECPDFEP